MMTSVLSESARDRHPQEKCASKCVRGNVSLCLHLKNFELRISNFEFCVDGAWLFPPLQRDPHGQEKFAIRHSTFEILPRMRG